MKKKRWWPGIVTGCFLTVAAMAMFKGREGSDIPWLLGMMPFVCLLLIRRAHERISGSPIDDEQMRFFVRAWNTSLLMLILLRDFHFSYSWFERDLYQYFDYRYGYIHLVQAPVYSSIGYVIAGTCRLLFWPRSVSLQTPRFFVIGWAYNTIVLYLCVFAFL